jgi:E3 Ubiquitin ligase
MLHVAIFVVIHSKFPVWAVLGIAAGIGGFVRGFRLLQRKRLILNTPASKIRSASMGLVEISGLARGPHVMVSPLKQAECYYYRSVAWELKQAGKNKEWVKVAEEALHLPFYLDDNTDKLLVDPTGAEMDLHCDLHEEYHESLFMGSDVPETVSGFLSRHEVTPRGKIKVEEYCIKPENFLFVLGTLSQNPGLDASVKPMWAARAGGSPPPPKMPAEKVGEAEPLQHVIRLSAGVASVPISQMTQQQKIAAALAKAGAMEAMPWTNGLKTDGTKTNGPKTDGSKTDGSKTQAQPGNGAKVPSETVAKVQGGDAAELLRSFSQAGAAPKIAASSTAERVPFDASGFDLHPPVVLMKGSNEPTFFISWRSQRDVVNTLNWKSMLLIWGGPVLVLGCVWALMMYVR